MVFRKAEPEDAAEIIELVRAAYAKTVGSTGIAFKTQPRYSGGLLLDSYAFSSLYVLIYLYRDSC